jgi:hypothetical protein
MRHVLLSLALTLTFTSVIDGIEVKGAGCQGKVPYTL